MRLRVLLLPLLLVLESVRQRLLDLHSGVLCYDFDHLM